MTSFLRRLIERLAQSVNRSAAGTAVPAGIERSLPGERPRPTARERTLMRRRIRLLRKQVGAAARDNGHTGELEAEIATLERALADLTTLDELLASGAFARCPACGDLVAARDLHCLHCQTELPHAVTRGRNGGEPQPAGPRHPATTASAATGASSGRAPRQPAR
jgi:hypothetical protein